MSAGSEGKAFVGSVMPDKATGRNTCYLIRHFNWRELRLGTPIALQEFLVGVSFMVIQTIVNSIDVTASAGVGVAEKVCAFTMLVPSAFSQAQYLKAYAVDTFLTAILFCFIGYYNGCGKTLFVMLQGITGAFCVRIPVTFLMSNLPDTTLFHIGLATPASSMVQIAMCIIFMLYIVRIEKKMK